MRPGSIQRVDAPGAAAALAPLAASPGGLPAGALAISAQRLPGRAHSRAGRWLGLILTAGCGALVASALMLALAPRVLPFQAFTVLSGSMQPTIPVGAVVIATPARPQSLRLGDIITFAPPPHPDRLVTHRIHGVTQTPAGPVFETQGDANPAPDPWQLRAAGTPVYRSLFHVPLLGYLVVSSQSPAARVAVALAGLLGFSLLWWRAGQES